MSLRLLALGDSQLMARIKISVSFHHTARRDKPSSGSARATMRKISSDPQARRSLHPRPGADWPTGRLVRASEQGRFPANLRRWQRFFGTHNAIAQD